MRKTLVAMVFFLSGCAALPPSSDVPAWLEGRHIAPPSDDTFPHCRGYGCRIIERIHFDGKDWAQIDAAFHPPPRNAEEEREAVKRAIGAFERQAGVQAGTRSDIAGTFGRIGDFQQDCIDESTNTTIFLSLLGKRGHLKFHQVRTPAGRFPVLAGSFWPHHTAVMAETGTGQTYAVDSWFENGGQNAHVVDLTDWSRGWSP